MSDQRLGSKAKTYSTQAKTHIRVRERGTEERKEGLEGLPSQSLIHPLDLLVIFIIFVREGTSFPDADSLLLGDHFSIVPVGIIIQILSDVSFQTSETVFDHLQVKVLVARFVSQQNPQGLVLVLLDNFSLDRLTPGQFSQEESSLSSNIFVIQGTRDIDVSQLTFLSLEGMSKMIFTDLTHVVDTQFLCVTIISKADLVFTSTQSLLNDASVPAFINTELGHTFGTLSDGRFQFGCRFIEIGQFVVDFF
mmetsp:Transcript_24768/g.28268  ORF Transcript_24768/g.28268 Transcript_24768/m.28268 type:complete len:250 (-) Transcript_24768:133-882(-)